MIGRDAGGDEEGGRRGPLHHLVDLFVCAPIGFVLDAPSLLPRWIDRGRQQADATLHALGLSRPPTPPAAPARDVTGGAEPPAAGTVATASATPPAQPGPEPATGSGEATASAGPAVESLAITDYDSLSASQVVPRLESLEPDELEIVRTYEAANRGRKTILSKIAQLQGS